MKEGSVGVVITTMRSKPLVWEETSHKKKTYDSGGMMAGVVDVADRQEEWITNYEFANIVSEKTIGELNGNLELKLVGLSQFHVIISAKLLNIL